MNLFLISLFLCIGFRFVESLGIFFGCLESCLEQFSSNALFFVLLFFILLHNLMMIFSGLLPISLPLHQESLLLLGSLLIYLLQMLFLFVRFLLEFFIFLPELFLKIVHILSIVLLLSITVALNLLHLVAQQPSQFSLVEHFLLLGFFLLKLV